MTSSPGPTMTPDQGCFGSKPQPGTVTPWSRQILGSGVADGQEKDSLVNARATGEFTCNLVDMATVESMNQSAATLSRGESEFDFAGLTPEPSVEIKAPRVTEAKASFECRVQQIVEPGTIPLNTRWCSVRSSASTSTIRYWTGPVSTLLPWTPSVAWPAVAMPPLATASI